MQTLIRFDYLNSEPKLAALESKNEWGFNVVRSSKIRQKRRDV